MSRDNIKLFYEALAKDKALQEKAKAIGKKYEGQKTDDDKVKEIYQQELVPLARQAGYEFTLAELKEYAQESQKPGMREVSEEELAGVAGGNCACVLGGGGDLDGGKVDCVCGVGGGGGTKDSGSWCVCAVYGEGFTDWNTA